MLNLLQSLQLIISAVFGKSKKVKVGAVQFGGSGLLYNPESASVAQHFVYRQMAISKDAGRRKEIATGSLMLGGIL